MGVDDLRGTFVKMPPELYGAIIDEAHRHKLRVAVHMVFLDDARELLRRDVDIFAHSVRDRELDDEFVRLAAAKGVTFVPTLIQARFLLDYADGPPPYLNDPGLRRLFPGDYLDVLSSTRAASPARRGWRKRSASSRRRWSTPGSWRRAGL